MITFVSLAVGSLFSHIRYISTRHGVKFQYGHSVNARVTSAKNVANACSCTDRLRSAIFIGTRQMAPLKTRRGWPGLRLEGCLLSDVHCQRNSSYRHPTAVPMPSRKAVHRLPLQVERSHSTSGKVDQRTATSADPSRQRESATERQNTAKRRGRCGPMDSDPPPQKSSIMHPLWAGISSTFSQFVSC